MSQALPPFEFLLTCSRTSLREYQLSKLNGITEARKEIRDVLERWVEETALSMLAEWIGEHGAAMVVLLNGHHPLIAESDAQPVPGGNGNGDPALRAGDHALRDARKLRKLPKS